MKTRFFFASIAVAVCALTQIVLAADVELPLHKAGLWQNDTDADGQHVSNQQCFDDTSQKKLVALSHEHCSAHDIAHNADGSWTSTGTCEFQKGSIITSRSTMIGDFNSKLVMTTDVTAPMSSHAVTTSKWVGVCKAGMKGGDVVMSDGSTINMIDEMSGQ